jgi:hypothetical protein
VPKVLKDPLRSYLPKVLPRLVIQEELIAYFLCFLFMILLNVASLRFESLSLKEVLDNSREFNLTSIGIRFVLVLVVPALGLNSCIDKVHSLIVVE